MKPELSPGVQAPPTLDSPAVPLWKSLNNKYQSHPPPTSTTSSTTTSTTSTTTTSRTVILTSR